MRTKYADLLSRVEKEKELTDEIAKGLDKAVEEFLKEFEKTVQA